MRIKKNNQAQPKASNSCPTVIHVYHYHTLAVYDPNSHRAVAPVGLTMASTMLDTARIHTRRISPGRSSWIHVAAAIIDVLEM